MLDAFGGVLLPAGVSFSSEGERGSFISTEEHFHKLMDPFVLEI